jgi:hypothetical protein
LDEDLEIVVLRLRLWYQQRRCYSRIRSTRHLGIKLLCNRLKTAQHLLQAPSFSSLLPIRDLILHVPAFPSVNSSLLRFQCCVSFPSPLFIKLNLDRWKCHLLLPRHGIFKSRIRKITRAYSISSAPSGHSHWAYLIFLPGTAWLTGLARCSCPIISIEGLALTLSLGVRVGCKC